MRGSADKVLYATVGLALLIPLLIAIYPERRAEPLTEGRAWTSTGEAIEKVPFHAFPAQYRNVRDSAIATPSGGVYRSWTPDRGIIPIELTSAPFEPANYISVSITGSTRSSEGDAQAYILCEANERQLPIFKGSVNVNVAEAILRLPRKWCPGTVRIKFTSGKQQVYNVGVGDAYALTPLSYVKSTFLGRLPFLLLAFLIYGYVMWAGASLAMRLGWYRDPAPAAFAFFGLVSLTAFYLQSAVAQTGLSESWRWTSNAALLLILGMALGWAGSSARRNAGMALRQYAVIWGSAAFVYFALLSLVSNGLGHWEPNYRFWPATWSSDNELPWMFAEALRQGWDLPGLFGGGWLPTDRPPLMAGSYLLLSDVFAAIQANNDGAYMRGSAYNASAVLLNSLWVPAVWWILRTLGGWLDDRGRMAILFLIACTPFAIFNTIYGWPKSFGAAFALVAFGLAWLVRKDNGSSLERSTITLFFVLGALSMLAHSSTATFLAPVGALFLIWRRRGAVGPVVVGGSVALAIFLSWTLFKALVLPSADPVTKFALTGDYGFGESGRSLWQMLTDRYSESGLSEWIRLKATMLAQAFVPLPHPIADIAVNNDAGATAMDKLRAWDFMLLSRGNLAIPLVTLLSGWVFLRRRQTVLKLSHERLGPFFVLSAVSVSAWLIVVVGFVVPPVLPVWPQAAVFGLALGGAVVVKEALEPIFRALLLLCAVYTTVVWIAGPVEQGLAVDPFAAIALAGVALVGSYALVRGAIPIIARQPKAPPPADVGS